MRNEAKNPRMFIGVKDVIPGKYPGKWSGYVVRFTDASGNEIEAQTEDGVRGLDCPCVVTVQDGKIFVE